MKLIHVTVKDINPLLGDKIYPHLLVTFSLLGSIFQHCKRNFMLVFNSMTGISSLIWWLGTEDIIDFISQIHSLHITYYVLHMNITYYSAHSLNRSLIHRYLLSNNRDQKQ